MVTPSKYRGLSTTAQNRASGQDDGLFVVLLRRGDGERGESVHPAGGFHVEGVHELQSGGVWSAVGREGDDDLGRGEHGLQFRAGVDDEVAVGAGGGDVAVQDEGVGWRAGDEAGFGEDVGREWAGEGDGLAGVAVHCGDGLLRESFEIGDGEGGRAAVEGDGERGGGRDRRFRGHGHAGHRGLCGEGERGDGEEDGGEGVLHGN